MMSEFQTNLEKYAELAVKVGVNIQEGQTLVVNTTLEGADLVRIIVKKLMKAALVMSLLIGMTISSDAPNTSWHRMRCSTSIQSGVQKRRLNLQKTVLLIYLSSPRAQTY